MIKRISLPQESQANRAILNAHKPQPGPTLSSASHANPTSPQTLGMPAAGLSRIYFGGVNLAKAIENSQEVARPQQLKSLMSLQEYIDTVEKHPLLLRTPAQYAQDLINREGVRKKNRYGRTIFEYEFFANPQHKKGLKGNQGSINDVMQHIRAAARGQDLGKKPIVLMGGPGSGKTTIGDLLSDGFVRYSKTDEGARYAVKLTDLPDDLRMGQEYVEETLSDPLLFLPADIRTQVVESAQPSFKNLKTQSRAQTVPHGYVAPNLYDYELKVEGALTPKTQFILKHLQNHYLQELLHQKQLNQSELEDEPGQKQLVALKRKAYQKVLENHVQAYRFDYDPNSVPGGIGVFSATDSKTLNTAKLNGQVSMVRLMDLPESDARRYDYVDGAAFRGNRGLLRLKEMHKNPEAFYTLLLDLAQSQLVEIESGNATVDTLIIADSNFPELLEKKGKDVLTAAMKRLDHIFVTYPLEWSAEREIQDGLFSDFEQHENPQGEVGHVAPHTKDIAALFAIMSRLTLPDEQKTDLSFLAKKAAAYDGRLVEGIQEQEVHEWYEKGQKTEDLEKKEGMDGLSVREMQTLTNLVTSDLNVRELNSIDGYGYLRITRDILEKNRLTLSDEMKNHALKLLEEAERHLDERVTGDVTEVLAGSHEYMQTVFQTYLNSVIAKVQGKHIQDPLTNQYMPVDTDMMGEIEKHLGLNTPTEREKYRMHLASITGALKKSGLDYQLDSDDKLKKAILKYSFARTVDKIDPQVLLSTAHPSQRDSEKIDTLVRRLMDRGYNEITAKNALARIQKLAKRDQKILTLN